MKKTNKIINFIMIVLIVLSGIIDGLYNKHILSIVTIAYCVWILSLTFIKIFREKERKAHLVFLIFACAGMIIVQILDITLSGNSDYYKFSFYSRIFTNIMLLISIFLTQKGHLV